MNAEFLHIFANKSSNYQYQSSKNGKTAVGYYGLKLQWYLTGDMVWFGMVLYGSVETNIRIFSSEYWNLYSIRGHSQNPNIIRIFEYFVLNIQKLFDRKMLEFWRNKDKIWTIFSEQGVDL